MRRVPKFINTKTSGIVYGRRYVEALTAAAYSRQKDVKIGEENVKITDFGDPESEEWVCEIEVV